MPDMVSIVDAQGDVQSVPATAVDAYLRSGFTMDTPELKALREEKEKYTTTAQRLKAFGEEALAAPSLDISHRLEEGLGVEKEDILKRKLYNPTESTIGGLAGMGAAAAIPGLGEGAAARAATALGAPMEAAAGLGGLAEGGVSAITKKLLGGIPGAIGEAAPELAGKAANMAAQTAIYNAAEKIDETHLAGGNFDQGVENALASTGDALKTGAMFGAGAFGAGVALKGAQKAVSGLQDFLREKVIPKATGLAATGVAGAASKLGNQSAEAMAKFAGEEGAAEREKLLDIKPPPTNAELAENRDAWAKEAKDKLQSALDVSKQLASKGEMSGEFSGIVPAERSKLLAMADPARAANEANRVGQLLRQDADMLNAEHTIFGKNIANKTYQLSQEYDHRLMELEYKVARDQLAGNPEDFYALIDDTKKTMGKLAYQKGSILQQDALSVVKKTHGMLKQSLEDADVWGQQAARQQSLNRASSDLMRMIGGEGGRNKSTFKRLFLSEEDTRRGPTWNIDDVKLNTWLNKLDTARGRNGMKALDDFLTNAQELIDQTRASGKTVGTDLSQDKYVQSLLKTAEEHPKPLEALGKAQENVQAMRQHIQSGTEQFGDQAKLRALANGPFVTGIDPALGASTPPVIGSMGGAALGAALGPLGAVGVGALGLVRGAQKAAKNPLEALQTIARIEKFNDVTSRKIQVGINDFLTGTGKRIAAAYDAVTPVVAHEAAKHVEVPYQKQLLRITAETSDPIALSAKYHTAMKIHDGLPTPHSEHAPKFTAAVADQQTKVHKFLAAEFPKDQSLSPGIGGSKYVPPRAEMIAYRDKEDIAKNPLHAVTKMKAGVLTPSDVEVLQKLWPNIYAQLSYAVTEKLAKLKHDLTIPQKRQISVLVGHPIDETQDPQMAQLVLKNFAEQDKTKQAAKAKADEGLQTLSDSMKTQSQKLVSS